MTDMETLNRNMELLNQRHNFCECNTGKEYRNRFLRSENGNSFWADDKMDEPDASFFTEQWKIGDLYPLFPNEYTDYAGNLKYGGNPLDPAEMKEVFLDHWLDFAVEYITSCPDDKKFMDYLRKRLPNVEWSAEETVKRILSLDSRKKAEIAAELMETLDDYVGDDSSYTELEKFTNGLCYKNEDRLYEGFILRQLAPGEDIIIERAWGWSGDSPAISSFDSVPVAKVSEKIFNNQEAFEYYCDELASMVDKERKAIPHSASMNIRC